MSTDRPSTSDQLSPSIVAFDRALAWQSPPPQSRVMGLLFERDVTPTRNIAAGFVRIPVGQEQEKLSVHDEGEEIYLVLRGRARFHLGAQTVEIGPDTAVYVAPGTPHRAQNVGTEELVLYWVNSPPVFGPVGAYKQQMAEWTQVGPPAAASIR